MRVGDTVRRPAGPWTDAVDAFLDHLAAVGFTGAPRALGRDAEGRQVLEYIEGAECDHRGLFTEAELREIGALLHDFHAAAATFVPPPAAVWHSLIPPDRTELVCHNDPAPWNLIRAERGWVLIAWDAAAPASRLWDLSYAAQSMAGLRPERDPEDCAVRLRAFVDGYGADDTLRAQLAPMLARRTQAMVDLLEAGARDGRQPWARIHDEDGPYWRATTSFLAAETPRWHAALTA